MKVAIVYWSGTGNTENIMNLVKKGVEQAGAQADVYMPWDFEPSMMDQYTNFAFGSPAMGDEQLETEVNNMVSIGSIEEQAKAAGMTELQPSQVENIVVETEDVAEVSEQERTVLDQLADLWEELKAYITE